MNDYISATILSLEEKMIYLDENDRRLLDEIANHLLMTHELLQNHRSCGIMLNSAHSFSTEGEQLPGDYLGNHH
ncbi:MAG: hypothetical protein ACYDEQ_12980 [Desulfocucumaceae bacterium]